MKELLRNENPEDKTPVSARALYEYLGYNMSQWKRWYTKNILNNDFAIKNEDYEGFDIESNGNKTVDFAITLDFAKKIAMRANTDKGEEARDYFLACEKKLKEIAEKPLTSVQMFAMQAQINLDFENRFNQIETKVDSIIQKQQEAEDELKRLPVAAEKVQELSLRDKIRLLVNRYCSATGMFQKMVWDSVYQTLYYNYHISLKSYTKQKNESWLDVAERNGILEKIHIVISQLLRDKGLTA